MKCQTCKLYGLIIVCGSISSYNNLLVFSFGHVVATTCVDGVSKRQFVCILVQAS